MNPKDFANAHMRPWRIRDTNNDELVATYCPFCRGGEHKNKETFAINTSKLTYNCKRGNCGKQGTFRQLCKEFNEEIDPDLMPTERTQKIYIKPTAKMVDVDSVIVKYFEKRGICRAVVECRGVKAHEDGHILFPYYENKELVLLKYKALNPMPGSAKAWRDSGGKPVFWGMDDCDPTNNLPLVITEGEPDAMSLDQAGIKNVVSIPSGTLDLNCITECWDWLDKFNKIILWFDNDKAGKDAIKSFSMKIGEWRCLVVNTKYKDANEMLMAEGAEALVKAVDNAEPMPMAGVIRVSDVETMDLSKILAARSGNRDLDRVLGGFRMKEVTVWSGVNSSGKSTFLSQVLVESIDQGFPVCAFSGELPPGLFRYWIDLQAAGTMRLSSRRNELLEAPEYYVSKDVADKIRAWYREYLFLYDTSEGLDGKDILDKFSMAARRYGCKVFLIDNLMTTSHNGSDKDFYRQQSKFVGDVLLFAKKYDVHVHLVAHPKKTTGTLTKQDISGSGDITNRADNVITVARVDETMDCHAVISVLKSRILGKHCSDIRMIFQPDCKRFVGSYESDLNKRYGWETMDIQAEMPLEIGGADCQSQHVDLI